MRDLDATVYFPKLVANTIFHEWLHNRLDLTGEGIQKHIVEKSILDVKGGKLAHLNFDSRMDPSPKDIHLMRTGLTLSRRQYTGHM
jgi:hypothetical protein